MGMSTPPSTSAEWADLLADPNTPVILIDRSNNYAGRTTLPDALAVGQAFAARIRPDVVPIDVDVDDLEVIDVLSGFLTGRRTHHLLFRSGRPGHFHVYAACRSADEAADLARVLRSATSPIRDVDATVRHRGFMRLPGTPHRLGLPVPALPERYTAGVVDQLRGPRAAEASPAVAPLGSPSDKPSEREETQLPRRPLGDRTYRRLVLGEDLDFRSRSEAIFAMCLGMWRAGWSEDEAEEALRKPSNKGGVAWRSILDGEPGMSGNVRKQPRVWFHRVWSSIPGWIAEHPTVITEESDPEAWNRDWLNEVHRHFRSLGTKRLATIMLVAGLLAQRANSAGRQCRLAERRAAELLCLNPGTVRSALQSLESDGFLRLVERGKVETTRSDGTVTTPSRWQLVTVSRKGGTTPPLGEILNPPRATLPSAYVESNLDASLNANARWLLLWLIEQPMTVEECAEVLGQTKRSVMVHQSGRTRGGALRQLIDLGLVRPNKDGTWRARMTPTRRATAAARKVIFHGERAIGRRRRMKVRHLRERQAATTTFGVLFRRKMAEGLARWLVHTKNYSPRRAIQCARRVTARRCGATPARTTKVTRLHSVSDEDGTARDYPVFPGEVVVHPGDAAISRRASGLGGRKIWVHRRPFERALGTVWQRVGVIVPATRLAEVITDLPDLKHRLDRVLHHEGDQTLMAEELWPGQSPDAT